MKQGSKKSVKRNRTVIKAKRVTVINPQDLYIVTFSRYDGPTRITRTIDVYAKSKPEAARKAKEQVLPRYPDAKGFSVSLVHTRKQRAQAGKRRNSVTGDIKRTAKKAVDLAAKGAAKAVKVTERAAKRVAKTVAKERNVYRIPPEAIAKFPQHMQDEYWKHWGNLEKKEEKATTPKQKQAVARQKRSFLSRLGTRLKVIGQSKKYKVSARNLNKAPRKVVKVKARHETDALAKAKAKLGSGFDQFKVQNKTRGKNPTFTITARANPKRRRNLDHKDSSHQVEVRKHWRAGGLSQWQRAHHAGQSDLFAHGIKAKP
jgi:hypothetical protein